MVAAAAVVEAEAKEVEKDGGEERVGAVEKVVVVEKVEKEMDCLVGTLVESFLLVHLAHIS